MNFKYYKVTKIYYNITEHLLDFEENDSFNNHKFDGWKINKKSP